MRSGSVIVDWNRDDVCPPAPGEQSSYASSSLSSIISCGSYSLSSFSQHFMTRRNHTVVRNNLPVLFGNHHNSNASPNWLGSSSPQIVTSFAPDDGDDPLIAWQVSNCELVVVSVPHLLDNGRHDGCESEHYAAPRLDCVTVRPEAEAASEGNGIENKCTRCSVVSRIRVPHDVAITYMVFGPAHHPPFRFSSCVSSSALRRRGSQAGSPVPLLFTGHEDGIIRVWDVLNRRIVSKLISHSSYITCLRFRVDSVANKRQIHLISTANDRTWKVWDLEDDGYNMSHSSQRHSHALLTCDWSPSLRSSTPPTVCVAGIERKIYVYCKCGATDEPSIKWRLCHVLGGSFSFSRPADCEQQGERRAGGGIMSSQVYHMFDIIDVKFNADGQLIFSASRDGIVVMWHVNTGALSVFDVTMTPHIPHHSLPLTTDAGDTANNDNRGASGRAAPTQWRRSSIIATTPDAASDFSLRSIAIGPFDQYMVAIHKQRVCLRRLPGCTSSDSSSAVVRRRIAASLLQRQRRRQSAVEPMEIYVASAEQRSPPPPPPLFKLARSVSSTPLASSAPNTRYPLPYQSFVQLCHLTRVAAATEQHIQPMESNSSSSSSSSSSSRQSASSGRGVGEDDDDVPYEVCAFIERAHDVKSPDQLLMASGCVDSPRNATSVLMVASFRRLRLVKIDLDQPPTLLHLCRRALNATDVGMTAEACVSGSENSSTPIASLLERHLDYLQLAAV